MATATTRAAGMAAVLATPETLAIMECRYGPQAGGQPISYGREHPHWRCRCELRARRTRPRSRADRARATRVREIVVSGDYKRRPDPTCACFVPVPCDVFITEATFGLPVFRHPETGSEIDRLLQRLHSDPSRCVLVGAYALGKAQRIISSSARAAMTQPIYFHGAIERLNQLYESFGVRLGELRHAGGATKAGDGRPYRDLPARSAQRPLVAALARSRDRDGLRLDAHPPTRAPTQCRAAADHLGSCRLGRADR